MKEPDLRKSHLYTRGGDRGLTSLIGGSRIKKCSLQLEAYGTIDELNAHIGLLVAIIGTKPESGTNRLQWIQSRLFDVGTHLAMPFNKDTISPCAITATHVRQLEEFIDELDSKLPVLRTFVLPAGCMAASQCHVCRTVCRRAERLIAAFAEDTPICHDLLSFVNRLSDFLFVYARFLNKLEGFNEISWRNDCY